MLTRIWPRHAPALAIGLVSLAFAGCGGGQDEGQGGQATEKKAATTKEGKPKPEAGAVIKDFKVDVASAQQARLTAELTKPADLELRVRRQVGEDNTKVGNVSFGRKPAGSVTINWNVRVGGKPLAPGRYQVVLHGGPVGRSERVAMTIPG